MKDFSNCKNALTYLFGIVEKYMFFPSLIEKWFVIVDSRDFPKGLGFSKEDVFFLIQDLAKHFVFCLERLAIIEPTYEIMGFIQAINSLFINFL